VSPNKQVERAVTIVVDVGDWDRREVYRGTNVAHAGLRAAKAARDMRRHGMPEHVGYRNPDGYDACPDTGVDLGLSDEVAQFLEECAFIGTRYESRRPKPYGFRVKGRGGWFDCGPDKGKLYRYATEREAYDAAALCYGSPTVGGEQVWVLTKNGEVIPW